MRQAALLGVIALTLGAGAWWVQGPLPGDVAITWAVQDAFGAAPEWAFALTQSAVLPLAAVIVATGAALGWWVRGTTGAVAVVVAYGLALDADKGLRLVIFVTRPAEPLVMVAAPSASSGLPSTFGLVYGAVFGTALLIGAATARAAWPARMIAGGAIMAGSSARVVLGGHWPSQMIASLALGLVLALLANLLIARLAASPRAR